MNVQRINYFKPPMKNEGSIRTFTFYRNTFPRSLLPVSMLSLLLMACGSDFSDNEPLIGSAATDIDEVENQPVADAKFSMGSNEYQLIGTLPTLEVVQQARSEIYIHE